MAERKFVFINPTYGFHEESDPTTDTISLAGLAMSGDIQMTGGSEVTGLPATPSGATAAASKAYVDNSLSGLKWRDPVAVREVINDALSSPPGSPSDGDAYIVGSSPTGGWSSFSQGDLVEWDGASWNLIVAGVGAEPADGLRVIVTEGTAAGSFVGEEGNIGIYDAGGDSWSFNTPEDGWAVLINGENGVDENTAWTYDTDTWVQFSGAGQINAGAGLDKSGNTIFVGNGDGIKVNADSIEVEVSATNPGLEFEGTSPNKTLAVQVSSTGGLQKTASGVEVKLDDTPDTLDVDADGLKVVGLPSLFKINDVAVGSDVTAANLDTLTDGSNADALHTHTIAAVDEAKRVEDTHTNNVAVSTGQVVRWSGTNNEITPAANNSAPNARAVGVARQGGGGSPATSEIVKHGVCAGVLSSATVNTPYFLGSAGALVTWGSIPLPGRIIRVGYAINATDLDVQIMDLGWRRA